MENLNNDNLSLNQDDNLNVDTSTNVETDKNNTPEEKTDSVENTNQSEFKVKYNGEEKVLTPEEAIMYAQKGMNYDKVHSQYNALKDNPVLKYANQLQGYADFMGVNLEQFMDILENQKREAEMSKYTQKGVDQETAQKIVELERKVREQDNNLSEIHNREELKKEIENFRKEYPTINLRDVPEEVFKIKESQGISLSLAYRLHQASTYESEIKSLKEKLNIRDEESQNSKLSTGSLTGGNDNANMGSLTPDAISKMSDKDFIKNRDIIWKGITS